MADFNTVHSLVQSGDLSSLRAMARDGGTEGFSPEEKAILTRTAAQYGQTAVLRFLFEAAHLYNTDPDEEGRTVLHFAAMSGNAETVRFAMDVLGFDPLTADVMGRTALMEARKAPVQSAYSFLTEHLGFTAEQCYRNPVLRGFHPDPSVVRVGEDYYLVNSSFVHFPGLPVYHSRDLVHWRLIGHAAENLELSGLAGLPGGYGYWAPDISYSRGRFWVVATLRRDTVPYRLQMITSAEDPRGPWTAPRFLPLDGIDPSLFEDTDGRRYILLNPGAILTEVDEAGNLISEPEMIFFGDARIKPEGPHLLKRDGWYYLFLAEGGTGPEHMETVMRSRSLHGPYEACPFNPILSRRNPFSPVGRSGHGKMVSTPDGRWFMVYLCGRSVEGRTVMGRETALDPVQWTADGWPMVNRLRGPSCLQVCPFPAGEQDASGLPEDSASPDWISPRSDFRSFARFAGETIALTCGADPAGIAPCSLLLLRQEESCFRQSVRVDLRDAAPGSLAGLTGYYDERSFFLFGLRKEENECRLVILEQEGEERRVKELCSIPGSEAFLRLEGNGFRRKLFLGQGEEDAPMETLRVDYLCDEGVSGGKRFTGATVGLAAVGSGQAVLSEFSLSFQHERSHS